MLFYLLLVCDDDSGDYCRIRNNSFGGLLTYVNVEELQVCDAGIQ
jgi:hypothetical protein